MSTTLEAPESSTETARKKVSSRTWNRRITITAVGVGSFTFMLFIGCALLYCNFLNLDVQQSVDHEAADDLETMFFRIGLFSMFITAFAATIVVSHFVKRLDKIKGKLNKIQRELNYKPE